MSNALDPNKINFELHTDEKTGAQFLRVISGELQKATNTVNKLNKAAVETAIEDTIAKFAGKIKVVVDMSKITESKKAEIDITVTPKAKIEYKVDVAESFLQKIADISGTTIVDPVLFAQTFKNKLKNNLNKAAITKFGNANLDVKIDNDFNPLEITPAINKDLSSLTGTIDANFDKPMLLVREFVSTYIPTLFDKDFNPGPSFGFAGEMSKLNTITTPDKFETKLDELDKVLIKFTEFYIFILNDQKKVGAITEDEFYELLSEFITLLTTFRKDFVSGSGLENKEPFKNIANSNFAKLFQYSSNKVNHKFDLSGGFDLKDGKFVEFRQASNNKLDIDTKVTSTNFKIGTSDWSVEVNPNRILSNTDTKLGANADYLTKTKVDTAITELLNQIEISTASRVPPSTGDVQDQKIFEFLEYKKVLDGSDKFDPTKNDIDKKIQEEFNSEIFNSLDSALKFANPLINPLDSAFNAGNFLDEMRADKTVYESFQSILFAIQKKSKDTQLADNVKNYYSELFTILKSKLNEKLIPLRENLEKKIKANTPLKGPEQNQLEMINEVNKIIDTAGKGNGLGLDSKIDLNEKEVAKTMKNFESEFAKVSKERTAELQRELRGLKSQRRMTEQERTQLESNRKDVLGEIEKIENTRIEVTQSIKLARQKVDEIFKLTETIERRKNRIEGSFDRFKTMEALRNKVWGDTSDNSQTTKLVRDAVVAAGGGVLGVKGGVALGLVAASNPLAALAVAGLTAGAGAIAGRYFGSKYGDARRDFYEANVKETFDEKNKRLVELYKEDDKVNKAQNTVIDMARMFRYYESQKGTFANNQQRYEMLSSIWNQYQDNIKKDGVTDGKIENFVTATANNIAKSHNEYQNFVSETTGRGFTTANRDKYVETRQKYNAAKTRRASATRAYRTPLPRSAGGSFAYKNPLAGIFKFLFG